MNHKSPNMALVGTARSMLPHSFSFAIDEYTLALLYLVTHERHEGLGARAWKGFDWDTMNRLHEKGYISNPIGKAKSVGMTEEGFLKAKELFERHFGKK